MNLQAQESKKFEHPNSILLDLGGHGLFYSLNNERILINNDRLKTTGQVGISYYPASTGIRDVWMPVGINEIFSFSNHHFEAGAGVVFIREALRETYNTASEWFWSTLLSGRIGYRYQKPEGRLIVRIGFTPVLESSSLGGPDPVESENSWTEFHPMPGASLGYSF